jgi:flagellar protein FliL
MAEKKEPVPAPAAAPAAPAPAAAAEGAAPEKPAGKPIAAFIPLVAVLVLAPVLTICAGQFVLLPQLKKQLAVASDPHAAPAEGAAPAEAAAHAPEAGGHGEKKSEGGHGKKGEGASAPANAYEFENVVVNLAGTMGTRYLKTTFMVTGSDQGLRAAFETNKPKLVDVSLNVLASLSLADLEEPGARNLIREKLIVAYNQALGRKLVEQVYFADFVVQ